MSWREWFPEYQVPKQLDSFLRSGVLKDKTSPHDAAIRFEGMLERDDALVLWIDHINPSDRAPGAPRFSIEIWEENKRPQMILDSDSVEQVVSVMKEMLSTRGGPRLV